MKYFVFRNQTIEFLFGKDAAFSGYDDISVVPDDAESFIWFYQVSPGLDPGRIADEVRTFFDKLRFVYDRKPAGKNLIVLLLDEVFTLQYTLDDFRVGRAVSEFNEAVLSFASDHPDVKVLDPAAFFREYGRVDLIDWRFYFLSQMLVNPRLGNAFRAWFEKSMDGISMKRKKCLVLDLDNTLWGGVLGEDGMDGIKMSGDYPGKAFHFFQEGLVQLCRSGIILAICSKNNESDVMEVWDKNPFMTLKKEHVSAWRINWNNKADNIKELSEELNIGLDSMVFLDDNPAERELIKQMLPSVEVPDYPARPYEIPPFFKSLVEKFFLVYSLTEEDRHKTELYKANANRMAERKKFTDLSAYVKSLDIHIRVLPADEFNVIRISQMCQKTNQFNLTTKRYSVSDIKDKLATGSLVYCMDVSDRFGDNGITGAIIVDKDGDRADIDSFLLSCRILGKGIESAFLRFILGRLMDMGIGMVTATYIPTQKNIQVADFYEKEGFSPVASSIDGSKTFSMDLTRRIPFDESLYTIEYND